MKSNMLLCVLFVLLSLSFTHAQEEAADTAAEVSAVRKQFDGVFDEWKRLLGDLRQLRAQAEDSDDDELKELVVQYDLLIEKGVGLVPKLRDNAIAVYKEAPDEDRQVTSWLSDIVADFVSTDRFSEALPAIDALVEGKTTDPVVYNNAGIAAFAMHDFEKAKEYFEQSAAAGVLTGQSQTMNLEVDNYIQYWGREQRLRAEAEALSGDDRLPRVKMETNRGTIIFELFEDEAPETVGNFVHLVKSAFYDGLTFHRVIGGFMAQGGCPNGDGRGGPGYEIYCECTTPTHRKHFTGTLSMAHAGRDTGGSQFFITFTPTPQLNGEHTAFGRVVEGLDVLAKIKRRDPEKPAELAFTPDKIIKAEVLNTRDHAYGPNKVK